MIFLNTPLGMAIGIVLLLISSVMTPNSSYATPNRQSQTVHKSPAVLRTQGPVEQQYDTGSSAWNGLSTLAAVAKGTGLTVLQTSYVQWDELQQNDLIFLLYPTSYVDPSQVTSFVRNGGHVIIADDFGNGSRIFERLGGRLQSNVNAAKFYNNNVFAPLAMPSLVHELTQGVSHLTTNHPAAIHDWQGMTSIFEFSEDSALVTAGSTGSGRYIAISDPSLFINRMLELEGNLQFAVNVLRYLRKKEQGGRLVVLSGDVILAGTPVHQHDDRTLRSATSAIATDIENKLDHLNTWLLTSDGFRVVTTVAVLLLACCCIFVLPITQHLKKKTNWTLVNPTPTPSQNTALIKHYESADRRTSYIVPAAIERDNVNVAIEKSLNLPNPLFTLTGTELVKRMRKNGNEASAQALSALLPYFRGIPTPSDPASNSRSPFLGFAEFEVIHRQTAFLLKGLQPSDQNQ